MPLEKACASAWLSMVAACERDLRFKMVVTSPDGGYRDLAMQQALIDDPQGPVPIAGLGRSSHGWGTAIDIWYRDMAWMNANAARFGFSQTWSNEPWHWQWNGTPAADYEGEHNPTPTAGDDDMGRLVLHPNGSVAFAANDGTFTTLSSMDQVNALVATGACPAEMIRLQDGFIWDLRLQVAARRKSQNEL